LLAGKTEVRPGTLAVLGSEDARVDTQGRDGDLGRIDAVLREHVVALDAIRRDDAVGHIHRALLALSAQLAVGRLSFADVEVLHAE